MKVDGFSPLPQDSSLERAGHTDRAPAQHSRAQAGAGRDEAHLLVDGERIQFLVSEIAKLPEVRHERVEALQRAVQEGRYLVSNEQIAGALFSDLLE